MPPAATHRPPHTLPRPAAALGYCGLSALRAPGRCPRGRELSIRGRGTPARRPRRPPAATHGPPPPPPRPAAALLGALLPRAERDELLTDLEAEYAELT